MSRRESIVESDPKRHRSKLDREPSPKRTRRDGKPEAERVMSKKDFDSRDSNGTETDKKPRHSLRDAAPLEPDSRGLRKDGEKKQYGHHDADKQASHLSHGHRSRTYNQHDDRRSDGKDDRRDTSERGSWRSSRDHQSNRRGGDDEKSQHHRKDQDRSTWRRDKFHESEDTQGSLSRKRPAFREKKIPEESEDAKDKELNNRQHNDRNWRGNLHSDRHERPSTGRDRAWNRDDERAAGSRVSYRADRERFNSGNNGRSGFQGGWTKGEKKWDHDLFDEANKSPAKATEEEQIAKVEALLAS
ncbi:unnamed protein product [Cochlearia groenlandica]